MPLPPLSFSGGTTASGATAGAYNVNGAGSAGSPFIVNLKGDQDATAGAAPSFNWLLIGGLVVVAALMLKKRKG